MSKNYVSVRVKPLNASRGKQQAKHDTRNRPPSYLEGGLDSTLITFENDIDGWKYIESKNDERAEELYKMMDENRQWQKDLYLANVGKKRPRNTNDFISGVITFSDPDGVDPGKLKKTAINYVWNMAKELGTKPLYLVEHRDEKTKHYHFMLPNADQRGKSLAMKINRQKCRWFQDRVAEVFGRLGFDRGEKREIPLKHKTVRDGHRIEVAHLKVLKEDVRQLQDLFDQINQEMRDKSIELESIKQDIKLRKKTRIEWVKQVQKDIVEGDKRKIEYQKYDAETKRLREKAKVLKQIIFDSEDKLSKLQKFVQSEKERTSEEKLEREEALRDVLYFFVETGKFSEQIKQKFFNEGLGTKWPSSIDISSLKKIARNMNKLVYNMKQTISR